MTLIVRATCFLLLVGVLAAQDPPLPPTMYPGGADGVMPAYVPFPTTPLGTLGLAVNASGQMASIGQSLAYSSNKPANWSLAPGSLGTLQVVDPWHAIYTAPSSIPSQNHYAGCPTSPNDAIWNVPVNTLPLHSMSAIWTAQPNTSANTLKASTDFGIGFADAATPLYQLNFYYTTANNGLFAIPEVPNERQHGSFDSSNNDHHTIAVKLDDCTWYETYNYAPDHAAYACRSGAAICNAQSGIAYSWNSQKLWGFNGTTDAAGMPLKPLVPGAAEIRNGIKHALRFVLPQGFIQKGAGLWPSFSGNGWGGLNTAPYGARFRLKASYDVSSYSAMAQNILRALQTYGMFLADAYPGGFGFTVLHDVGADREAAAAVGAVAGKLHMTDFEVVDESTLMLAKNIYTVNRINAFVQPVGSAALVITDQTVPTNSITLPIVLQPVLVGVQESHRNVVAGGSPMVIPTWVTGSPNQAITWTIVSGPGAITDTGAYVPPASVLVRTPATLKVTAAADSNASAFVYLTLFPASSSGAFRVSMGSTLDTLDGLGQRWWNDQGMLSGTYVELGGDYPNWTALNGSPYRPQYQSTAYTYGDDMVYRVYGLKDGAYRMHLLFGNPYQGCAVGGDVTKCPLTNADGTRGHSHLDILGTGADGKLQRVQSLYDFEAIVGYLHGIPTDLNLPVHVVGGKFELVLMTNNPAHGTKFSPSPALNGMELVPVPTP